MCDEARSRLAEDEIRHGVPHYHLEVWKCHATLGGHFLKGNLRADGNVIDNIEMVDSCSGH